MNDETVQKPYPGYLWLPTEQNGLPIHAVEISGDFWIVQNAIFNNLSLAWYQPPPCDATQPAWATVFRLGGSMQRFLAPATVPVPPVAPLPVVNWGAPTFQVDASGNVTANSFIGLTTITPLGVNGLPQAQNFKFVTAAGSFTTTAGGSLYTSLAEAVTVNFSGSAQFTSQATYAGFGVATNFPHATAYGLEVAVSPQSSSAAVLNFFVAGTAFPGSSLVTWNAVFFGY